MSLLDVIVALFESAAKTIAITASLPDLAVTL
jgi:hypothetical protein